LEAPLQAVYFLLAAPKLENMRQLDISITCASTVVYMYMYVHVPVYATNAGSPYDYRNFMVCTVHMGDNDMRKPRPRTKLVSTLCNQGLIEPPKAARGHATGIVCT
jgi:hypothetical protein